MHRNRLSPIDAALGVSLVGAGSLTVKQMVGTSRVNADPFDSSMFWWAWLLYPALVGAATWARPAGHRPLLWTAAVVAPFATYVAFAGTAGHDPDEGASLWLVGEIFIAMQAVFTLFVAMLVHASKRPRATPCR
ncbi:MAG TPA: hypothetical protein VF230_11485 [Acidimicrobiales bacterium]